MKIELKKIRLDGGTQPRVKIDETTVQSYTEVLLDGKDMPDITVFFDGADNWLADGFHRYHAHKRAGLTEINIQVINGTKRDAFIFSLSANAKHGLPRSNEDKRNSVKSCFEDIELSELSDKEIAKICDVSAMTVGRVRKLLQLDVPVRKGKDGRKIDTSAITHKFSPPSQEPEYTEEDRVSELATEHAHVLEENVKLKDQLAVASLMDSEEAKVEVQETIETLREQVKNLEIQLRAVTASRNEFQNKNAEMIKQMAYWKKRAEKAEAK
jgi:ParB-like chromosome segregation protein Spo0J